MSLILDGSNGLSDVDGTAATPAIRGTDANTGIFFPAADTIAFSEGGVESGRFDSSGNLLIGTTSGGQRLSVVTASGAAASFSNSSTSGLSTPPVYVVKGDNNSTTSNVFVQFIINAGGNGSGQINANGSGAAAFGSFSDSRLKEKIVDLPSQLENITALRPVEFDYIESEGGGHQIGFIAQEMQEVYPDSVGERFDGMLTVTGWSRTEARLVKAIQELKAELDTVKAELATLKASQ
jgi:hypothetical protein